MRIVVLRETNLITSTCKEHFNAFRCWICYVFYPISSPQNQINPWCVHGASEVEINLEPGTVAHAYNAGTQDIEVGRVQVSSQPDYISRACLKGREK